MMKKTPKNLPTITQLIDDIKREKYKEIWTYLGISERTFFQYKAANSAPRPVHLALFWVSRWGLSEVNCELENAIRVFRSQTNVYQKHNKNLIRRIAYLERIGNFETGNEPIFEVVDRENRQLKLI